MPKYSLEEIVIYKNSLYIVQSIWAANWSLNSPFVYNLMKLNTKHTNNQYKSLSVRENLLKKVR